MAYTKTFIFLGIILTLIGGCKQVATEQPQQLKNFKLDQVKLLDGPLLKAQQAGMKYIMALDPDRLMAPYLKEAGLQPKKDNYGNWENTGLDGHIGGHYLSSLAIMYAATGYPVLKERMDYTLDQLQQCQDKNGNGYLGGIPGGVQMWKEIEAGNIESGSFSLNKKWVPLYNIHKIFAGLFDAYTYANSDQALQMLVKLTDWCYQLSQHLSDAQIQELLVSEHGGLNEVFVNVAEATGDQRYLELAKRYSHMSFLEPLINSQNKLTGMHANTQIPKVIGFKRYADAAHDTAWQHASVFFWNTVIDDWTISIGGNSVREHFHPANDFTSMVESEQGPETCNTYNMLKLTKMLFMSDPQSKYINYYERAMLNHILSSENPNQDGFVYFTPMRPRHYRVYSQPQESFWCCVGSGLENHGKYAEMIYSHLGDDVFVNMYLASELSWKAKDVTITQKTWFPYAETSELTIAAIKPTDFALMLRRPQWVVDGGFKVQVNGQEQPITDNGLYLRIARKWNNGDVVTVNFPMKTTTEYLPDSSNWVSFIHGPIVLGAISDTTDLDGLWGNDSRMGHIAAGKLYPLDETPAIVTDNDQDLTELLEPIPGKPFHFKLHGYTQSASYPNLVLEPFFNIHGARYIVYWPVYQKTELEAREHEIKERESALLLLKDQTIDHISPGEQQPESDHFIKHEASQTGVNQDMHWRDATAWFSYQLKNPGSTPAVLRITYFGLDNNRKFSISINGSTIANVELTGDKGPVFYEVDYPIPATAVAKAGDKVELKFKAATNSVAGGIYGIRLLNANKL